MADLALDDTGDLLIFENALQLVEEDSAIVQQLTIRLRFFLGEWFLDKRLGIPYYDRVLRKNPKLAIVRGILRSAILTTPGIETLDSFEFDYDAVRRSMTVRFSARRTSDGSLLDYSKEFIIP